MALLANKRWIKAGETRDFWPCAKALNRAAAQEIGEVGARRKASSERRAPWAPLASRDRRLRRQPRAKVSGLFAPRNQPKSSTGEISTGPRRRSFLLLQPPRESWRESRHSSRQR